MAWMIGIDEAGYGPNLGPLVMTAVGCRVPDNGELPDLWQTLAAVARRQVEAEDEHVVVDDSKAVYSPAVGLSSLETSVLAALVDSAAKVADYLDRFCPGARTDLRREPWFRGTTRIPNSACKKELADKRKRFADGCVAAGIEFGRVCGVVVCPRQFNELAESCNSKGAVLAAALSKLLRWNCNANTDGESLHFFIDKHGGRNTYAAMLQDALTEGMVVVVEESAARSRYRVAAASCDISVTLQPRADSAHFCVALASMASKYLRELLMLEFNRFWQRHIPDLKPTAGYPGDSRRYFDAIRPVLTSLGIDEEAVWRRR